LIASPRKISKSLEIRKVIANTREIKLKDVEQ
jgi:hypothetical protein